jgi:ABC transporter with metal-binding/Fe-S-binding domain ATP-binding protein
MKCAVLYSGGKDSTYAAYLAKKHKIEISCLITIISKNIDSYMFHTPSISQVSKQAEIMNIPLIIKETQGEKERELKDLELAIKIAKKKHDISSVLTGSVESAYQASRVQKICDKLNLDCFNPLWQKDQFELLQELINENFKIIITGIFAYPLNDSWLERRIDQKFIKDAETLYEKYKINPAGEGGEYETFVLNCPLFYRGLIISDRKIFGKKNSWKMEIEVS